MILHNGESTESTTTVTIDLPRLRPERQPERQFYNPHTTTGPTNSSSNNNSSTSSTRSMACTMVLHGSSGDISNILNRIRLSTGDSLLLLRLLLLLLLSEVLNNRRRRRLRRRRRCRV